MNKQVPIVAIVGRTNVGKSSLFNTILGRREAITAEEEGTTRDSLTARANWEGKDFWLVDTAGLKTAEDDFELTIQEQINEAAATADLIIVAVAADTSITEEDRRVATLALKSRKIVVLAINKIDKNPRLNLEDWRRLGIKDIYATSATQKTGLNELLDSLGRQIPKTKLKNSDNVIRLALLGRPNVGKSSLFNVLAKKQQAVVSDKAGTTRDVNRLSLLYHKQEIELADTAGIRRSGKIERGVEKFSVLRALSAIEQSDICLVLMEVNELNVHLDQKIAGLVQDAGKGLILVVSKWDTYEKDAFSRDHLAAEIANSFAFVPWAPLVFTSSETGQNVTKLFELALETQQQRHQKFRTAELNKWLQKTIAQHPPAGLKGRLPKLNYIVQETDIDMPSFKIFGSHTRFLHWSYKRYMERSFREQWPLGGTPLKFWFIDKRA